MNDNTSADRDDQAQAEVPVRRPLSRTIRVLARLLYRSVQLFLGLLWLWTTGAICYLPWIPHWLSLLLAGTFLLAAPWLLVRSEKRWETMRIPLAISLVVLLLHIMIAPSNDRPWAEDQAVLPRMERRGDQVVIRNVRNFTYHDLNDFKVQYTDRTLDLNKIDSIWFGVEEFSAVQALAHTFLTFGFRDGESFDYISFSVEIRKEVGEEFSPVSAMFRQFELMYVVGEERDLLGLRSIHRQDVVYLYPMKASQQQLEELFLDVTERMNELADHPEFYHTLTSNCTNNLVYHLNRLTPGVVNPLSWGVVFPGYSDRLAFQLGLIDTDEDFRQTKRRYRVDPLAYELGAEADFSQQLRQRFSER
jgi:hypothetical protein